MSLPLAWMQLLPARLSLLSSSEPLYSSHIPVLLAWTRKLSGILLIALGSKPVPGLACYSYGIYSGKQAFMQCNALATLACTALHA